MNVRSLPIEQLVEMSAAGDRRATGRLLSLVERGDSDSDLITELTHGSFNGAHVVGVTGPPGAGKSTLVARLVAGLVSSGKRPAVLAVDPSSPLTGGAILGDRVRMADVDSVAFIRSVATRGHAGGLALAIPGGVRVLTAAGFDPVVIETVGVGQVEVDITAASDTAVVVVTPDMGDAVQANKAGLLEVADVFVVNKADRPGADNTRRDLELMLELSHVTGQEDASYRPPIVMTDSLGGVGVVEVDAAIQAHRAHLLESDRLVQRHQRRARFEIANRVQAQLSGRLADALDTEESKSLIDSVAVGEISPITAARLLRSIL